MDIRQSDKYADYMSLTGWQVLNLNDDIKLYVRSLGALGSILKVQRFRWPIDLSKLEKLAKEYRALLVKLEPDIQCEDGGSVMKSELTKAVHDYGFEIDSWPLIPPASRRLDLSLTEDKLWSGFSENCRRNIRMAQKLNLKIRLNDDDWFYANWRVTARKRGLHVPSKTNFKSMRSVYGNDMQILNVTDNVGNWLAGIVLLITSFDFVYYYYSTTNQMGKNKRATYLAIWEGIKLAKKINCKVWDWEGVADDRFKATRSLAWKGFGEFKSKFGGTEVRYIGPFRKYYGIGKVIGVLDRLLEPI